MQFKGLPPFPVGSGLDSKEVKQWFAGLRDTFAWTRTFDVSVTNFTFAAAQSTEDKEYVVPGLKSDDIVTVKPASLNSGVVIGGAWTKVAGTDVKVVIRFGNLTTGTPNALSGNATFVVLATRK